ncbi:MAG: zinc-binding alcohol dehydrogenase family protein, partial [Deltaproteobacteria bacterium]|nr:zinc-binding alcohol dehydrogenase family protein [Deltaproteobacteria bacterium]
KENPTPLKLVDLPTPAPKENEILLKVSTCGVCHTELDEIEGRTPPPRFPVVLGHQIIGRVEKTGSAAGRFQIGDRVGVAWIFSACGACRFCRNGDENLCPEFKATGRDANGGYAEYTVVPEEFAHPIPPLFADEEAAPLLCAGAVGYRALRLTGMKDGQNFGLVGFGASAHLVLQMAKHKFPGSRIFVFARSETERSFARELGAFWAGGIDEAPPERLGCAIDTTPAWQPIVDALKNLDRGGRLVINAIRKEGFDKETLLNLDYPRDLWLEKEIKSVANISRADVEEFLDLAAKIPIRPEIQEYSLGDANQALRELKEKKIRGAKVLKV